MLAEDSSDPGRIWVLQERSLSVSCKLGQDQAAHAKINTGGLPRMRYENEVCRTG